MRLWPVLIVLAGCSHACPPPPPPPPPPLCPAPVPLRAVAPAPHPTPPTVTEVTGAYRDVAEKEAAAVTAPGTTPEYVQSIHAADKNAQAALSRLAKEGLHPLKNTLYWARSAVKTLSDVLAQHPGE
jgi:hypothetical protein